jgi:hypothetical protein
MQGLLKLRRKKSPPIGGFGKTKLCLIATDKPAIRLIESL